MTPPARPQWLRRPDNVAPGLAYGADYNPEQWPREVWRDDVRLMREAGVNIVSLAIFSWAKLQPAEDTWRFGWLDEVMGLLYDNGIAVDLATATASPPPWLTAKHPEILPVNARGETVWPGGRQHWRPTSPIFREHALALVDKMAARYADHPALTAWHVSNELGCHNVYDYSDDAARAFRDWLRDRYATLDALNHAWGTAFWSQEYSDWAQILPPRLAATHPNPTQQLDFKRFSSDALRQHLRAERDILHRHTPDVPVTTNFMIMGGTKGMDYAAWAADIDFVSNDHYVEPGPQAFDELSFSANLTGNIAGGRPWFLMEHSTSAVNWQPVNVAKKPGELARDSLTHVAHGADAVCFFQWRQSAAGAEKYHSAMVPHAGEDSDVFRAAGALGATLRDLAPVAGTTREQAPAAIVFHWDSWWAAEADSHPTDRLRYRQEALDWYTALLNLGIRADVVPLGTALDGYSLVVAPMLHMVSAPAAKELQAYAESGGHLVTTYFSGIVDEHDHVWLGGHPGALRDLLGVRVEEFAPLLDTESVTVDGDLAATLWTERVQVTGSDVAVLSRYAGGEHAGHPAVTRRAVGAGSAAYVSTRLGAQGVTAILAGLAEAAGVTSELPAEARGAVELTVRHRGRERFAFLVNRTDQPTTVTGLPGEALVGTRGPDGELPLAPRGAAVLRLA
ncbi:beta-galactosidase [Catellatospora methionotrophica]|uniref:Beta-galactosidase n=1 Tax=Catellatospora methionotrophica TaxID=121620 RepID=A0A8J3LDB4_9ACTN|nr:beta-galactosidase [Catellatospora methionotrophica]GIG17107.1 beta-galactosidase [Catellatospora methionotrophica]